MVLGLVLALVHPFHHQNFHSKLYYCLCPLMLKDLYYKISRIIRNYSKEVLSFGPGELTTKEFLAKLEGATALSDGIKNTVKELVVHCDLVKFSGSTASIEEFKSHFDGAKNIIEQINAAMTPKENDK